MRRQAWSKSRTRSTHPRRTRMADRHRGTPVQGQILWTPTAELREQSEIGRYLQWLRLERKLDFPDYDALWRWSVTDLDGFWASLWDYFEIGRASRTSASSARGRCPARSGFPARG